ncbi:MAG: type II secretion system F family protein [Thermodesulfovibrionales bacterium]
MPQFEYKATTNDGNIVEGIFESPDEKSVLERLRNLGFIPLKVEPVKQKIGHRLLSKASGKDVLIFTSELTTLLKAGLPIDRSLNILSEISESKGIKSVTEAILRSIREGSSFSEALSKHPTVFSRLYVNMVRSGEAGGVLEQVLEKLVEFLESAKELKDSIYSAMIYPSILLVTGGASIIVLLTYVLPKFTSIFGDIGVSLPITTRLLISFSTFIRDYWWLVLLIIGLTAFFINRYINLETGKRRWDAIKLRLFGDVIRNLETARFCRTLGTLLKSGVPLIQALQNAKDITNNSIISDAIEKIAKDVKEGKGLSGPLAATGVFPRLALSMIKVGEESGSLEDMLLRISNTYEKGLRESIKRFIGFIEPAMILLMGIIIGFIVLSMLAAIFSITDLPM